MIYGYARVSSKGQERYGNSLTDQETKLTAAGCEIIYKDSYTGTKMERPEFTKLLNLLQEGDTLVVTKLDRFARSAAGGVQTMQELVSRGVKVNILNMGVADSTPMGKLMITILLGFAEFERDMIVERTSIGKAVAKEKDPDWREGRKKKEPAEFTAVSEEIESGTLTVDAGCAKLGISRSTYYRLLKREVA